MAVTDLSDSLPYWARQGGPGPTGGPGAAPQGSGAPPGGNSTDWLQYLSQMFGVSPAQAATMMQSGGGPGNPVMASMQIPPDYNRPPGFPPGDNPVQPPPPQPGPPPGPPQPGPPPGPPQNGPAPSSILNQARGVSNPPFPPDAGNGPPAGSILPQARGVAVQPGPMQPGNSVLAPGAAQATAPPPVPGPLATGGASGGGSTANPRFVQLDQGQNTDPTGRNRGPQMTALNLGGLFGRGGVNPNAPAANAQPMSGRVAGPMAQGGIADAPLPPVRPGVAPSDYGPLQRNRRWSYPSGMLPT